MVVETKPIAKEGSSGSMETDSEFEASSSSSD